MKRKKPDIQWWWLVLLILISGGSFSLIFLAGDWRDFFGGKEES